MELGDRIAILTENIPLVLWKFYNVCLECGFTKAESFKLTEIWLVEVPKGKE